MWSKNINKLTKNTKLHFVSLETPNSTSVIPKRTVHKVKYCLNRFIQSRDKKIGNAQVLCNRLDSLIFHVKPHLSAALNSFSFELNFSHRVKREMWWSYTNLSPEMSKKIIIIEAGLMPLNQNNITPPLEIFNRLWLTRSELLLRNVLLTTVPEVSEDKHIESSLRTHNQITIDSRSLPKNMFTASFLFPFLGEIHWMYKPFLFIR